MAIRLATGLNRTPRPPQTGNITSMQYDLQSKTLLWAATSAGDVLVFHTRHRKAKGSSMPECRRKLPAPPTVSNTWHCKLTTLHLQCSIGF